MAEDDQRAVIAFLESPDTHGGAPVTRIDTHSAIVFLAGPRAWKLKRAVRYDYLDFSTLDQRRLACEAEVRLNRRTAPGIYRAATPVTREAGGVLAIGGSGLPVEWLVDMNRFDDSQLFDRLAAAQRLDLALMRPLAAAIARFHAGAAARLDCGGPQAMAAVAIGNDDGFLRFGAAVFDGEAARRLTVETLREVARHRGLLELRRAGGLVRQCHGDLHLRNIVLLDGQPTLFDAIEFNDALAGTDVLYDLAFLLMDLWRRGLRRHANAVWNGYLAETGDHSGLPLLPLFLSCRAAVRAKTSATAAHLQTDAAAAAELRHAAAGYLALARGLLFPPPPRVVAIGGFSGTGKSTLAAAVAPQVGGPPGAVVLRSDELRKQLCGVPPLQRLDAAGYSAEMSRRVYAALAGEAASIARAGHGVVVDAVFARPADRQAIARAAFAAGVPFLGLWLEAPEPALVERLARRSSDVSDADAAVVRAQLAAGAGGVDWRRLDAARPPDRVLQEALSALEHRGGEHRSDESRPPGASTPSRPTGRHAVASR